MKIAELFTISRNTPLAQFEWGGALIEFINPYLPAGSRADVTDTTLTGDQLYVKLLQLSHEEMVDLIEVEISLRGNQVIRNEDDEPPQRHHGHHHRRDELPAERVRDGRRESRSRFPTVALICAVSLVVLCFGLAITQAILSVKSGRPMGDGRTISAIASVIGDVARAFSDSKSPSYSSRPDYGEYEPYPEDDRGYRQRPTRRDRYTPEDRQQEMYDVGPEQEPSRPQSGHEPPPYD